jgi:hypothetical protein
MGVRDSGPSGLAPRVVEVFDDVFCDDEFDTNISDVRMASGLRAWRVFGTCSAGHDRLVATTLIFAIRDVGIVVYHIDGAGDVNGVRDADNRLFRWFQATF